MGIWSGNEIAEAIKLLKEKLSYQEIGSILNRSSGSVRTKLAKFGYKSSDENKEIRNCLNCNTSFETTLLNERKFCDNRCSAIYNNKLRGIRNKTHDSKCITCYKPVSKNHKFCNNTCSSIFKQNEKFEVIKNGDKSLSERIYKLYLINEYGNKCMECGWCKVHPVTGNIPVQIEHVDGNSDNNSLDNLKLLCPNCHSLTPTFGALNRNNKGRESKRNIYRKNWRDNMK